MVVYIYQCYSLNLPPAPCHSPTVSTVPSLVLLKTDAWEIWFPVFLPNPQVRLLTCMGKICPSGRICSVRTLLRMITMIWECTTSRIMVWVCPFFSFTRERAQTGALALDELPSNVIQPYKQLDNSNYTWIVCVWFISSTYVSTSYHYIFWVLTAL